MDATTKRLSKSPSHSSNKSPGKSPGYRNFNDSVNKGLDVSENDRRNAVFVTGKSLQYILKDETLSKLFLTICSMCSICVGS